MIELLYSRKCKTPSDINEHLPTLRALADECDVVVELGSRLGVSTTALCASKAKEIHAYDIDIKQEIKELASYCGRLKYYEKDVLRCTIPKCDLLFIDTLHNYNQLKAELKKHGSRSRKYIAFHDTVSFSYKDEVPEMNKSDKKGLWPAINEFLKLGTFAIHKEYKNNNGLLILKRNE